MLPQLLSYAPFPYRLLLAAMHYNENADREATGFRVTYMKYRAGKGSVKKVKDEPTRGEAIKVICPVILPELVSQSIAPGSSWPYQGHVVIVLRVQSIEDFCTHHTFL